MTDHPSSLKHLFLYINTFCDKIRPFTFLPFTRRFFKVCKAVNRYQYRYLYVRIAIQPPDSSIDISYFIYTFYNPTKPINECYLIQIIWLNYFHFLKNPEGAHKALFGPYIFINEVLSTSLKC